MLSEGKIYILLPIIAATGFDYIYLCIYIIHAYFYSV